MLQLEKRNADVASSQQMPSFVFCVNMALPGPPNYHLVMYFAVDDMEVLGLSNPKAWQMLSPGSVNKPYSFQLQQFLFGDSDEYRNKVLKMIPRITEGSFLLKTAVGTKPFILGKYLKQTFVQGERFLEVIVDVGSSPTTQKLLGLKSVYVSSLHRKLRHNVCTIKEQSHIIFGLSNRKIKLWQAWHLFWKEMTKFLSQRISFVL